MGKSWAVFTPNIEKGSALFEKLIKQIGLEPNRYSRISSDGTQKEFQFDDGSIIRFINPNHQSYGLRYDKIWIDEDLSIKILTHVILP